MTFVWCEMAECSYQNAKTEYDYLTLMRVSAKINVMHTNERTIFQAENDEFELGCEEGRKRCLVEQKENSLRMQTVFGRGDAI